DPASTLIHDLSLHDALPIYLEADAHVVAVAVAVAGGEVAVDAAADPVAFRPHADVLGHLQAAVGGHDHLRVVAQDPLVGLRRGRSEEHTSELQSRENLVCRL